MAKETTLDQGTFKVIIDEDSPPESSKLKQLDDAVQFARDKLKYIAELGTSQSLRAAFKVCMRAYFRFSPAMSVNLGPEDPKLVNQYAQNVMRIMSNVATLYAEMKSKDLTLKAFKAEGETSDAAMYVQRKIPQALYEAAVTPNPKTPASFYGPIFFRFDQLGTTSTLAGNLVHEGTHRFLGTRDWAYCVQFDMVDYEESYVALNIPIPQPPKSPNSIKAWYDMTTQEAINNADSYAGFIMNFQAEGED